MYKLHLILKYLRRRFIAWFALGAVMLCTTMVLVVISVMGGWLDMFESSARGLTGDIVIKSQGLSGFPHYEDMIRRIEADPQAKAVAAAPSIFTYGVVNIANRKTDAVQVIGYPLDKVGQVNKFPESLYRQHTAYVEGGKTPPAAKTWDMHETTSVALEDLPKEVAFDEATNEVRFPAAGTDAGGGAGGGATTVPATAPTTAPTTVPASLLGRLHYFPRRFDEQLQVRGKLTGDESRALLALSSEKAWQDAVRKLAGESNWPGMIPASGVLDIRKGPDGKIVREDWKYDLWTKLTVVGVGSDQSMDERSRAERQYRIADDSRTGMWQYDTKTVYVPFDILQTDLGMQAKPRVRLVTVFRADSGVPARVLGQAPEDGEYALHVGRGPPKQTVTLKKGDPLGFRKAAEGAVTAIAGEQTFEVEGGDDAEWRLRKQEVEPARATEIHVKLQDGANLIAARDRIKEIVQTVVAEHGLGLRRSDVPKVETWDEASALFIGAIRKEKMLVTFLFGIISIVAIFLIFCIFYMIVAEKTKDIGIIKSVGATNGGVAGIFLGYGLAIGLVGTGLGLLASYLIVRNINEIHDWMGRRMGVQVWNPEVYAFDRIPNQMAAETGVIMAIGVLASVLGALIPAVRAAAMHPVEALRWE